MKKKSVIIKLQGGLGNQLFQYVYGRKLMLIENKQVIFDISFFGSVHSDTIRPFLLSNFTIDPSVEFKKIKQNKFALFFKKIISKITNNNSFYQSEKYFKGIENTIRKEITLKKPFSKKVNELKDKITSCKSVSLHIRRGDYVSNKKTNAYHGICDLDYYQKAISYIKKIISSPTFFIFSDDIDWVKNNLKIKGAVYVSDSSLTECEELLLMSQCNHNIIANSTFSWWGAWLNTNSDKIVLTPKKWTSHKSADELNILPKSWIQI